MRLSVKTRGSALPHEVGPADPGQGDAERSGPVDVVHGPNFVVPPSRRAARVVTVHDLTAVHHPELCTADVLHYPPLLRRAVDAGAGRLRAHEDAAHRRSSGIVRWSPSWAMRSATRALP